MDEIAEITGELESDERIVSAYLHGSVAKGTAREDSDLDVSLVCKAGTKLSSLDILLITEKISSYSAREIHLSQLTHDNLIFLREVAEHGDPLFSKDSFYTDMFMCTGLSLAAKLREDSKEVIDAYTA